MGDNILLTFCPVACSDLFYENVDSMGDNLWSYFSFDYIANIQYCYNKYVHIFLISILIHGRFFSLNTITPFKPNGELLLIKLLLDNIYRDLGQLAHHLI